MNEWIKPYELLAPVGNIECFYAAVSAGCDAVYLSGKDFGARAYASNFTTSEIKEVVDYAHMHLVKVYVTVNTLIKDEEFKRLFDYLKSLQEMKVDAVIVQDLGVIGFIKKHFPSLEIHASTQLNTKSSIGFKNLKALGVNRVVISRETSIDELKEMDFHGLETEVFIHGAMCFSSSGNCLFSSSIGGRSGNRGRCAQPCRKTYDLICNNEFYSKEAFLSMKDLMTIEHLNDLLKLKIHSFKIEGRMKSKEYVYTVVKHYKKALDDAFYKLNNKDLDDILVTFNREFSSGYLFNTPNSLITNTLFVNHQGLKVGNILKKTKDEIEIKLSKDVMVGDGLRIKSKDELGFFVTKMYVNNEVVKEACINDVIKIKIPNKVSIGDEVVKTFSKKLSNEVTNAQRSYNFKTKLDFNLTIFNNNFTLSCKSLYESAKISMTSNLEGDNSLSDEAIKNQLSKLGNTPFCLNSLKINRDDTFVSFKQINELRRNLSEQLIKKRLNVIKRSVNPILLKNRIESKRDDLEIIVIDDEKMLKEKFKEMKFFTNKEFGSRITNHFHHFAHSIDQITEHTLYVSPYMNVFNQETLEILKKMTSSTIFLSLELSYEELQNLHLNNIKQNIGMFVYGKIDLMVSKHCVVGKKMNAFNKKCGSCLKNKYYLKDEYGNIFSLACDKDFDCTMRILDNKATNLIPFVNKLIKEGINTLMVRFTDETLKDKEDILNDLRCVLNGGISKYSVKSNFINKPII